MTELYACSAFGVTAVSSRPLPGMVRTLALPQMALEISFGSIVDEASSTLWETCFDDGEPVRALSCFSGAHLLTYGTRARFSVATTGFHILCEMPSDRRSERFLLDTVLWWAALRRGLFIQHAAVLSRGNRAVAIEAPSGVGKTTLARSLLDAGWSLISDDVLVFDRAGARGITALAGPPVMNVVDPAGTTGANEGADRRSQEILLELDPGSVTGDTPLVAYLQYDRSARTGAALERQPADPLALLGASWAIPGEHTSVAQFEAVCDLAQHVPRWRLSMTPSDVPERAAELVEQAVAGPR